MSPVPPIAPFVTPFATNRPVEANEVRGNDNVLRETVNALIAEGSSAPTANVSTMGDRPAPGVFGRFWFTLSGTDEFQFWLDDGTQWRSLLP